MPKIGVRLFLVLVFLSGGDAVRTWGTDLQDKRYTATASLLLTRHGPHVPSAPTEKDGLKEFDAFCETQAGLMKSRFVLTAALRNRKRKQLPNIQHADDANRNALLG